MWDKVQQTVNFLKEQGFTNPEYAIVLGSGLGNLVDVIQIEKSIPYKEIPNFPISTVAGHSGNLIYGTIAGKKVVVQQGRFHYYEGWDMKQVTFPIRVFKFLGCEKLIVSNASGIVNAAFKVGDITIIKDHINMMPEHPLHGPNDKRFGPRFVDMHDAYDKKMIATMEDVAAKENVKIHKGIYLALQGPTFETPAEYGMVRRLGADCVGMSTVPEVIVAKHMNMICFGVSVITDLGLEGIVEPVSHEEVQKAAKSAEKTLSKLIVKFLEKL